MCFGILSQIYYAALIVVGVSYKMILTEYKFDAKEESGYGSDNEPTYILGRMLASEKNFSTEERRQRISYFFA